MIKLAFVFLLTTSMTCSFLSGINYGKPGNGFYLLLTAISVVATIITATQLGKQK